MTTTATDLRSHLFGILDSVITSGEPVYLERKGVRIRISRDDGGSRLLRLKKRPTLLCDPEDIIHDNWLTEWKGEL